MCMYETRALLYFGFCCRNGVALAVFLYAAAAVAAAATVAAAAAAVAVIVVGFPSVGRLLCLSTSTML